MSKEERAAQPSPSATDPGLEFDRDEADHDEAQERPRIGRYTLLDRLGSGTWGIVHRAHDPHCSRMVAIKVLHSHTSADEGSRLRWQREVSLLGWSEHPNVVTVLDVGMDDGRGYVVTELVPGARPLSRWQPDGAPDTARIVEGFVGIAEALDVLHRRGLVHRDIKPDNVLVAEDGRLLLSDFSLAVQRDHPSTTPPAARTPEFVAPEVLAGAPADPRSDVYGLAATMWLAVCGEPPFGGTPPRALEEVLRRGLAADRTERFPSAASLAAALRPPRRPRWILLAPAAALALGAAWLLPDDAPTDPTPALDADDEPGADGEERRALDRIAARRAEGDLDGAAHEAMTTLRAFPLSPQRGALELALGEVRLEAGAVAQSQRWLESAFLDAVTHERAELAARAAVARAEVALELEPPEAASRWLDDARAWWSRAALDDPSVSARLAIASSRLELRRGSLDTAVEALPAPDDLAPPLAYAVLRQQGRLAAARGDGATAQRRMQDALALASTAFGPDHPRRAEARRDLAAAQRASGELEAAARSVASVVAWLEHRRPDDHAALFDANHELSTDRWRLGELEAAAQHALAALEHAEALRDEGLPRRIDALADLAAIRWRQGRRSEAEAIAWRALAAAEAVHGQSHARLVALMVDLTAMLTQPTRTEDAKVLLDRAEAIARRVGGHELELASILTLRARGLRMLGDLEGAARAKQEAVALADHLEAPSLQRPSDQARRDRLDRWRREEGATAGTTPVAR